VNLGLRRSVGPSGCSYLQCKIDGKKSLYIGLLEDMRRNRMKPGENTMTAHMPVGSKPLARVRPASTRWARIDPIVYATEARRRQARAAAEALGAAWRGLRGWFARRSERRQAIAQLSALDPRLLADIGLRHGDIELAVDGLLADPRVTRRARARGPVLTEGRFERRRDVSAATAGSTRPAASEQPGPILDRAA
jgi:uncharacterized protein YjiS (DUF1127 family)